MATNRWKVTLIFDIDDDSHPRKFVPDCVKDSLHGDEDLIDYEYEKVSDDFELLSSIDD